MRFAGGNCSENQIEAVMKKLLIACLTLSLFASLADADVVVMQSGKMHEGTVMGFDGTDLTVKI